jgi:hypothetical protein
MKTKELIRQLKEADPSGKLECVVGNVDIHYVDTEPGYYDGWYEVLIRDEREDCYNIIGARVTRKKDKVQIHTLPIEWALMNDPEMHIYIDDEEERYVKRYEKLRFETRKIYDDLLHFLCERIVVYSDYSRGKWKVSLPSRRSLTYGV